MKPLLVSFSGGRTSALMTRILLEYYKGREIAVVYANTGREHEKTLEFVNNCDREFDFRVTWVEAVVNPERGKGTTHKIVDFESAARKGEPFESVIQKYGIPNTAFSHCTRELKTRPIHHYIKSVLGWRDYETAIGIRADESHRINRKLAEKEQWVYPLTDLAPLTKQDVLDFWVRQPFDLGIEEFEGNCDNCYKKSQKKLVTNIIKNPDTIDWWIDMERKYSNLKIEGRKLTGETFFYRGNKSAKSLVAAAAKVMADELGICDLDEKETDCFCKSTE